MTGLFNSSCDTCKKKSDANVALIQGNVRKLVQLLVPSWAAVAVADITLHRVSVALSSKLYIVTNESANVRLDMNQLIFRINNPYSSELNPLAEVTRLFSNELQVGPKLLASMGKFGQIEQFLDSRQSERRTDLYGNAIIAKTVANYIGRIHAHKGSITDMDPTKSAILDGGYNGLMMHVAGVMKDPQKREKITDFVNAIQANYGKDLEVNNFVEIELKWLKEMITKHTFDLCYRDLQKDGGQEVKFASTTDIVVSHIDIHHRNILVLNNDDAQQEPQVRLIDFETAGYCNRFWEFSHFFCELAVDMTFGAPDFFAMNFKDEYPSLEYRQTFVRNYLEELLRRQLGVDTLANVAEIPQKSVDLMVETIEMGRCWNNFGVTIWSVWNLTSSFGEVKFDFKRYSAERVQAYFDYKKTMLEKNAAK